jgi:CRP/FNR family cyclic AMP-dependent transcriptional regulator
MNEFSVRKYLTDSVFFGGLDPEFIDFLAEHAAVRQLREGQVLFRYGDRATHFYVVLSGEMSVEVAAIEGPPLVVQDLGPDQVLGWSWLISPNRWTFQARARAATDILEFDGDAVLSRCEDDPRFGYELLKRFSGLMSERLHFARQKMMDEWRPPGFA